MSTYSNIYDKCFPLKVLTRKKAKLASKRWITRGLLVSIKAKSKLYKKFLNNPNNLNDCKYKKFKNKLTHLLKSLSVVFMMQNLKKLKEI